MGPEEIEELIRNGIGGADVVVDDPRGDRHHFEARIIWDGFDGMRLVQRHRAVYGALGGLMGTDKIHALQLLCLTPAEFESRKPGANIL